MKLYYLESVQVAPLAESIFVPSLRRVEPQIELVGCKTTVPGNGDFRSPGWFCAIRRKYEILAEMADRHEGEVVAFFDVDVVFFRPFSARALMALGDLTLVCQAEHPASHESPRDINTGIIFLRGSAWLADCFAELLAFLDAGCPPEVSPQAVCQEIWRRRGIRFGILPRCFASESNGGMRSTTPPLLYHANDSFPDASRTSIERKSTQLAAALISVLP